jgi:O-antigen/teichoic acid export membrane protein
MNIEKAVPSAESRTQKSLRNVTVGVFTQIALTVLSFVSRTVFISVLGVELLGLNALLVSVMGVLAMMDLGVTGAIMFALYAPISRGDRDRVAAIIGVAKMWYRIIACLVGLVGLAIVPVLDTLVRLPQPVPRMHLYYFVLLASAVAGYCFAHRTVLLNADQRMYLARLYSFAFNFGRGVAQIAVLLAFESFLGYVLIQLIATAANNLFCHVRVGQLYPHLRERNKALDASERREIGASVRALGAYRIAGIALNNSDPILVSLLLGTITLGYYSNYMLIFASLALLSEVVFSALTPSVGNLVAAQGPGAARAVLEELAVLVVWMYGLAAVALALVMNDLVEVWLGRDFVLSEGTVVALCLNFYVVGVMTPVGAFRGATGMFRQTRYVVIVTVLLNVILSVLMGRLWGLEGILFATLLARALTNLWYEPFVLFRQHLRDGARGYVRIHLVGVCVLVATYAATTVLTARLEAPILVDAAVKLVAACTLVPTLLWFVFRKVTAFEELRSRVSHLRAR